MLLVAFIGWWYGPGWRDAAAQLQGRLNTTILTFSVPILLRTMFAPWRRIVTRPGGSLQDKARAMVDNAVSRFVGLAVRLLALASAGILLTVYTVIGGIILVLWPLLPVLGPALIIVGLL
jgi:hypothetical protein